jgi:photosystem II stability/assembly factor-like uncharacterized protein
VEGPHDDDLGRRPSVVRRRRTTRRWLLTTCALVPPVLLLAACGKARPAIEYDGPVSTSTTSVALSTTTTAAGPQLGPWVNATGNLAGTPSECGNMSFVSGRPGTNQVLAGVALQGLWSNDGSNLDWSRIGGGAQIRNRTTTILYDPQVPNRFWEAGSYTGPGVVRTDDGGRSFQALGDIFAIDGVSVDFTDPGRRTMLAGGHDRPDLWRSTDGGSSWQQIAPKLPEGTFPAWPLVIDAQTYLLGTRRGSAPTIMRTTDGGATWTDVFPGGVAGPPLVAKDGSIYWALELGAGVVRSSDGGVTWTRVTPRGVLDSYNIVETASGDLLSVGASYALVSSDKGVTWRALGPQLPIADGYGVAYSEGQNAAFVWYWTCSGSDPVPADAIQRLSLTPSSG